MMRSLLRGKFSVITPTYQRESYLIQQYANFKAQTWRKKEWLIWDDSPTPSSFFLTLDDPQVQYIHSPHRLTIGEKRNLLIEKATGEYIAHFDDDDFYGPHYLERMATSLKTLDFVKISAWYVYSESTGFWGYCDYATPLAMHYHLKANGGLQVLSDFQPDATMLWGYGFSYAYRRKIWETFKFEALNFGEDHQWVLNQLQSSPFNIGHFKDEEGLVLHVLHKTNASEAFPQYRLPQSLVPRVLMSASHLLKRPELSLLKTGT
jgi:glycosyltransferase involved in cell wall biosynthesis